MLNFIYTSANVAVTKLNQNFWVQGTQDSTDLLIKSILRIYYTDKATNRNLKIKN